MNSENKLIDTDGDGLADEDDIDDDGDGWTDLDEIKCASLGYDASSVPIDTDNDGICDFMDQDNDGDGVLDAIDLFPYNSNESVDFDNDGVRRPHDWPDVLGSIANYLIKNGYSPGSTNYEKKGDIWKSVYAYNHSENYVMAVLGLTEKIKKRCNSLK